MAWLLSTPGSACCAWCELLQRRGAAGRPPRRAPRSHLPTTKLGLARRFRHMRRRVRRNRVGGAGASGPVMVRFPLVAAINFDRTFEIGAVLDHDAGRGEVAHH